MHDALAVQVSPPGEDLPESSEQGRAIHVIEMLHILSVVEIHDDLALSASED